MNAATTAAQRPAVRRAIAGAALLLYVALALVFLRAPLGQLDTRIASDRGDPVFVLWAMQWGARQMGQGMPSFWHAPIFHPVRWATTFSDHLLLFGGLLSLAAAAGAAPLATYNTLVILSFAFGAWSCFLILRRSGIGVPAALLGGCIFGFSPYRFQQLPHLQILWTVCIPPTLWTFDRLLVRPERRTAGAFLAFYALQILAGNYLAYMIHLPLAVLLANRLADGPSRAALRLRLPLLGGVALACAGLVAAVFGPYVVAARELGLHRSTGEMLQYGGSLASYLDTATPWYTRFLPRTLHREENGLFAGFLASALALWGLARGAARLRAPRDENPAPVPARLARGGLLALATAGVALGEWMIWSGEGGAPGIPRLLPALLIATGVGVSLTDAYVTHGRYTSNKTRRECPCAFAPGPPIAT